MAELSDESDPESVSVSSSDDEEDNDGRGEGESRKSLFSLMLSDEVKHEAKVQQDPEYDLPEELRAYGRKELKIKEEGSKSQSLGEKVVNDEEVDDDDDDDDADDDDSIALSFHHL